MFGSRRRNKSATRSPLKDSPLRYPGQSIDEEIQRILHEEVMLVLMFFAGLLILTVFEWVKWYTESPPQPGTFTLLILVALPLTIWKLWGTKQKLNRLAQGRNGERAVGQFLEALREKSFKVIHDLIGDNFNIDHVLIGPQGIFTIETKTISLPLKGRPTIDYDGEQILINGYKPDSNPVAQAKAEAHWLKNLINDSTGRKFEVRPIVVYPGWFINAPPNERNCSVWVLNPRALPTFVESKEPVLSQDSINLVIYHLSRFVRTQPARPH